MNIDYEREAAWHYLCGLTKIGVNTINYLLEYAGDVLEIIGLDSKKLLETGFMSKGMLEEWDRTEPDRLLFREKYELLKDKDYNFISREHSEFPEKLNNIQLSPHGLWIKGKLPGKSIRSAAIIGSRECTDYGLDVALKIGKHLAQWGIGVISGMALGIDAAGQWGALNEGGYSAGILGCGVDIIYPRANVGLYESLIRNGGIISEYAPGVPGFANNFRQRNRIISGLSDCVIVVEARERSGTQLTVSWALDQGKDIFCVPGRITDEYSRGCNQMINQGATIINDLAVIKEYFNITEENRSVEIPLTKEEEKVLTIIGFEMQHFEQILMKTNCSTGNLWKILFDLERKRLIYQPVKNYFKKKL